MSPYCITIDNCQWLPMIANGSSFSSYEMSFAVKCCRKVLNSGWFELIPSEYQIFPSTCIEIQKKNENIWLAT